MSERSARDDIVANIRRSLGVKGREAPRRHAVEERLARAPRGIIPERGQLSGDVLISMFKAQAEAAFTTVAEVDSTADVPHAISIFLRNHNLPATIRMGDDLRLRAMAWDATSLEVKRGKSDGQDLNGVSHAFGAVAESGTLVLVSGPENPSTVNFLPDNHIVVLSAKDVAGDYESVLTRVREVYGRGAMPRTLNFITGPSRSADIEQTLLLGAHGPRRLHVVLVKG